MKRPAVGLSIGALLLALYVVVMMWPFNSCPVGRAAYVHFPGAGLVSVLLARLGLR